MVLASVLALRFLAASHLQAQWVKSPTSNARLADGKPDLRGPAPRTADGKPDLSGMWQSNFKFNTNLAAAVAFLAWTMNTPAPAAPTVPTKSRMNA